MPKAKDKYICIIGEVLKMPSIMKHGSIFLGSLKNS